MSSNPKRGDVYRDSNGDTLRVQAVSRETVEFVRGYAGIPGAVAADAKHPSYFDDLDLVEAS